jgi:hypothetical protein
MCDNSLSDSDQPCPMPRDFQGPDSDDQADTGGYGGQNFGIIRQLDGHDHFPTTEQYGAEDGDSRLSYRNVHTPDYEDDSLY